MLKLIYTESGFYIERITASLEAIIAKRVVLATRLGESLHVAPNHASFLVSIQADGLTELELSLDLDEGRILDIVAVDADFVEVNVRGTWIARTLDAEEGILLVSLSDRVEQLLHHLWEISTETLSYLN